MKTLALAGAALFALVITACSTQQAQNFAATATADAQAIAQVNTALIQLNSTVIANQTQLAAALAQTYCPIVNASVSLGAAIQADPNAAKNVQSFLTKAGAAGATAEDVCTAAGYGPTATSAPAAATTSTTSGTSGTSSTTTSSSSSS